MEDQFSRTELILGKEKVAKLKNLRVAIFGVGGVGSFVVEALARIGIGHIEIYDKDKVDVTNINRQLYALHSTIGKYKVDVAKERILDINPEIEVKAYRMFITKESADDIDFNNLDYIVDAVDSVTAKLALIKKANDYNIKIISAMGAGNKVDPTRFEVSDIYETSICPLAKVMRHELKKIGINKLKVVYSKEEPIKVESEFKAPGSVSFVPSVVGLIIAGEVVKDLLG